MHQRTPAGVALDVRLVDHVEPEFVTQVVELLGVRVVGRAHGVDVVALHHQQVGADVVDGDRPPVVGMDLVAVHAVDHHGDAVDQELVADHLDTPEAHLQRPLVDHRVAVAERHRGFVPRRRLVRPRFDAGDLERGEHAGPGHR